MKHHVKYLDQMSFRSNQELLFGQTVTVDQLLNLDYSEWSATTNEYDSH